MNPKVSVILPTYNRAKILKKSISGVLNSSYRDFELIIVDDNSTDDTDKLINTFDDGRIKYIKSDKNLGAAGARNLGIDSANGTYIAFEDSDDFYRKEKLEKQVKLLDENPEYGFSYHKIRYDMGLNEKKQNLFAILPDEKIPLEKKNGKIHEQLLYDNLVDCPSIMVRKDCICDVGGFDTNLDALEDYELALRLSKKYEAGFINEVLLDSSFSNEGVSGSPVNYLTASCIILAKHKADYLRTGTFNHRLEIILLDSEQIGIKAQVTQLLEKLLS